MVSIDLTPTSDRGTRGGGIREGSLAPSFTQLLTQLRVPNTFVLSLIRPARSYRRRSLLVVEGVMGSVDKVGGKRRCLDLAIELSIWMG